jgi:putative tryptophan/tyrosine transport system substrate-binding protein
MRRREFIAGLGSAAITLPCAARAQQGKMRRIGILFGWSENSPLPKRFLSTFAQQLHNLGWTEGSNLRLDVRWAAGDVDQMRVFAKELIGLEPDLILTSTTPATAAIRAETVQIPIVFAFVSDPIGAGFIESLSRPGANITGFVNLEPTMGGKWVELLREIAPGVKRVSIMFNPDTASGSGSYVLPSFEAAARSLNVATTTAPVHSDAEIEAAIAMLGQEPGGGLVVESDAFMLSHRAKVISLATQYKVPAVSDRTIPTDQGGLLTYGPVGDELAFGAAIYADRILYGAHPALLPVQIPTKFEFKVNLKTAKALGLTVPSTLIARADEVIE